MGRPERVLDPDNGPVEQFAHELRQLRQDAGSPSYRELADKARYSASVLSRAASGRELPSLPVTLAYVSACGGDTELWAVRWHSLQAKQREQATGGTAHQRRSSPFGGLRRYLITGLALVAVIAAVTGWALARPKSRHSPLMASRSGHLATPSPSPTRSLPAPLPEDGADPIAAHCAVGAVTVVSAVIKVTSLAVAAGHQFGPGTVIGTIELRYSPRCRAAWGRLTPTVTFDHPKSGQETLGATRPSSGTTTRFQPGFVEEAYSDLLSADQGCLVAYGSFEIADGHRASARTACWRPPPPA